eukprot:CAMPEP_0118660026 /NCGR_PEP_ID=MMETSP0785-20121206/15435_1 /TAXON_ID=91992 /ORGANISM="Bolidomonas pacifica, Strain CCMP 1866" /LENGTH=78 /DNA_ID=CAMNT_0006553189 /DNA_START=141 /DNA_END=374 /DNA_ORIENTATION=+
MLQQQRTHNDTTAPVAATPVAAKPVAAKPNKKKVHKRKQAKKLSRLNAVSKSTPNAVWLQEGSSEGFSEEAGNVKLGY